MLAFALPSLVAWKVWFSFPKITFVALSPSAPSAPLTPLVPSFSLTIVVTSEEPSLAVTLNDTDVIEFVYNVELLDIVKTPLATVSPFVPDVTLDHELPPFVLYCHLLKVQLVNSGVSVIVLGE